MRDGFFPLFGAGDPFPSYLGSLKSWAGPGSSSGRSPPPCGSHHLVHTAAGCSLRSSIHLLSSYSLSTYYVPSSGENHEPGTGLPHLHMARVSRAPWYYSHLPSCSVTAMCLLKRNLREAVDSVVGVFPHCCVTVAPSGDLILAASALLSRSHASVTCMTPCALHALLLTAQGALPDILGIPHMLLYLRPAHLPGRGSRTLFTLSSPSRGSDSVHFDLNLPNLQENTVCGDW